MTNGTYSINSLCSNQYKISQSSFTPKPSRKKIALSGLKMSWYRIIKSISEILIICKL